MRIGIVSDTHGHREYTLEAVRMLQSLEVERVIHCGDIGAPEIPPLLAEWPTEFVLGNVDYSAADFADALSPSQVMHGEVARLNWEGVKIAVTHGHQTTLLNDLIQSGDWDLVCCGHTHQAKIDFIGDTIVVNPGALYRATIHSIGYAETGPNGIARVEIVPVR